MLIIGPIDPPADDWHKVFGDAYVYINQILQKQQEDGEDNLIDVDTIKRATSIIARAKIEITTADIITTTDGATISTTAVTEDVGKDKAAVEKEEEEDHHPASSPDVDATATVAVATSSNEDEDDEQEDIGGSDETIKKAPKSNKSNKRRSKKNK